MLFFYSRESVIELKDIAAIDNRVGILFQQCTDAIKFEGIFACDNTADDIRHNSPESELVLPVSKSMGFGIPSTAFHQSTCLLFQ